MNGGRLSSISHVMEAIRVRPGAARVARQEPEQYIRGIVTPHNTAVGLFQPAPKNGPCDDDDERPQGTPPPPYFLFLFILL